MLFRSLPNSTVPDSHLLQAYWRVIEAVEAEGQYRDQLGQELAYHNRIHISETLTALSYFLMVDRQLSHKDRMICLIAMAGHDYAHQGNFFNALEKSQEEITAQLIGLNYLAGIPVVDKNIIHSLILGTEHGKIRPNHESFRTTPSDNLLLSQVLINEADIAASLLPDLSFELTKKILNERGQQDPSDALVESAFSSFVSSVFISSKPALSLLMPHLVTLKTSFQSG